MVNNLMLKTAKDLHFLVMVNWIATSTIPAENQRLHATLTSLILNSVEASDHLGVLSMPQWTYMKRQLYKQESLCLQSLANNNLNLDRKSAILQEAWTDKRDQRPPLG